MFLCITLRWLYLFVYYVIFGFPITMGSSKVVLNILIVFALRCWTVSYYDTVSYVFYVFYQDMPLIWACHILCVFYTMSLLAHQVLDRVLSDPCPVYIYFFTNSLVVLIIPLYINTTRGTYFTIFISYHVFF